MRLGVAVIDGIKTLLQINSGNSTMAKLGTRVLALTAAFLLVTPFIPLYQNTEGQYTEGEGIDIIEFTQQNPEFALADVMTEDGFLLKPALNTTETDRSNFNEVFAYTVEPGDTLSSVAQRFGLKKETIMWENNIWNPNSVRDGMTLKILPVDGVSHMVKKGQTLASIAKQYGVDKSLIVRQNQLEEDTAEVGSLLIVPGAKKALPTPSYVASAPGTAPAGNFTASGGRLLWPVAAGTRLTQSFHRGHYALDLASKAKGPIYAAASGKVIKSKNGYNGGYGNYIIIDHGDGMQTLYAHNEKLYVTEDQYIDKGQTIAWMGSTGRSTGNHLHFEVRINGVKYNPMNFF